MTSTPPEFDQFEWLRRVVRSDLDHTAKLVGTDLFNYANGDGSSVKPGPSKLAKNLNYDPRTVTRALKRLRDAGWITLVSKGGVVDGRNTPNHWHLTFPSAATASDQGRGAEGRGGASAPTPQGSGAPTPQGASAPTGGAAVPYNQTINQLNNQINDQTSLAQREARSGQGSASSDAPHLIDPEFSRFWDAYPNKRDRKRAYPVFIEAKSRASVDTIIAGAERYRDDPNRDWTKEPKTWLEGDCWDDAPIPPKGQSSKRTWWDQVEDLGNQARYLDAQERDYVEAEFVEVNEPAQLPAAPEPPVLTVVKDNDAPDAFTAFLNAYPKKTPPAQRYAAHRAWQAAAKAHGADRVLKAAQRYTKAFEDEGKDPAFAKRVSDWFKDDSFDKHLPHRFEPYKGMNVVKWLDLVTEHRDIAIAQRYATGDTFLPQWPAEYEQWTKAEADAFREADKDRWFREHRQLHLDVLTRRYGAAEKAA